MSGSVKAINVLQVSTFDVDVTPPIGVNLAYEHEENSWDLGLRAKGVVLLGAGQPIVLCAIDWILISNDGMDEFKSALATAAGTIPQRVSVNVLHQHDAPLYDSGAERILLEAGIDPSVNQPLGYDGTFARDALRRLTLAVKNSLSKAQSVTHLGLGKAKVEKIASNRNSYGPDGKVRAFRGSATKEASLRAEPEGIIDPEVSVVSLWNGDQPLVIMSYYATHPQSYYHTKVANPDFVGVARFFRQLAVPDALHIHFNGAGGNVAAGKYNDGAHENRLILAERLADGMKRAWEATERQPIGVEGVKWSIQPVSLPPARHVYGLKEEIKKDKSLLAKNNDIARELAWLRRAEAGKQLDVACLTLNNARILYMPGELFVEYQLAAKAKRPDLFVTMAAYGDLGTGYVGTSLSYEKGGYEVSDIGSFVAPEVEKVLMNAIHSLLEK